MWAEVEDESLQKIVTRTASPGWLLVIERFVDLVERRVGGHANSADEPGVTSSRQP